MDGSPATQEPAAATSESPAISSLSSPELERQITELTGHLNAATHRWLVLLAEFDTRNAWNGGGTQSCAHWLNWKCGIAMGAAREKVRVAHALVALPKISSAMAEGKLSYSKVRELTRVADTATEDMLLMIALHGTADHVQKTVRHFRRAKEIEELGREAKQQANRFLTYSYDEDGSLILQARLPAETGALVLQALTAAMEHLDEEATESDAGTETDSTRSGDENVPCMVRPAFARRKRHLKDEDRLHSCIRPVSETRESLALMGMRTQEH